MSKFFNSTLLGRSYFGLETICWSYNFLQMNKHMNSSIAVMHALFEQLAMLTKQFVVMSGNVR